MSINPKNVQKTTGAAIAIAAAGLMGSLPSATAIAADSGTVELSHCYGVNICKGHNDCGTDSNSCGGHAECKGTGFVGTTTKSCGDIGGEVRDEWRGEMNSADLIHCNGVNICKGHNDCGTANNSCAGHASCKGTGFVAMPAKACADVGGEAG